MDALNTNTKNTPDNALTDGLDFSGLLKSFYSDYKRAGKPVEIDFREIIRFGSGAERYTHLIHPYPAKLIMNIPYFFVNCKMLVNKGDTILDPFCGSGTVLLEGLISGNKVAGADANPLARMITQVKTSVLNIDTLNSRLRELFKQLAIKRGKKSPQAVLDWDYWYSPQVKRQLCRLANVIDQLPDDNYKRFFEVCFSSCVRKVSLADPRISVPVRLNPNRYDGEAKNRTLYEIKKIESINVFDAFEKISKNNIKRLALLSEKAALGEVIDVLSDARNLKSIKSNSIDLIITSPPYVGAQKYIRSCSLSIGWLGLSPGSKLRNLEKQSIGREHYSTVEYCAPIDTPAKSSKSVLKKIYKINSLRAHIATNYLIEMKSALEECYRVLDSDKYFVLVVGNNVVCGLDFNTQKYLREICENIGFSVELVMIDNIHSRGLMTKRNKTASVISSEWILIFRKRQ